MIITDLISTVAVLFVMMVPGIVMKKCRLCPDGFGKGLSNLVLYIAQPILIVYSYISYSGKFSDIWLDALLVFAFSVLAHTLFSVVAMLVFRKAPDAHRRMLRLATIFSNAAFMGIPLIEILLGAEAAIYASIYNITFNLFLWTLGVHLCTWEKGRDMDGDGDSDIKDEYLSAVKHTGAWRALLKVALHPVTIASFVGIILLASGANTYVFRVDLISDCLLMIKNLVAPLSMVVIGIRLADINLRGFFNDVYMYGYLMLRHLLLPLAVLGIVKLISLIGVPVSETVYLVTVILAATPAASSATMFAEMYDCDATYASRAVAVSTLLCIATMPLVIMIAQL